MPAVIEWDIGVAMLSEYDGDDFLGIQIDAEGEENSGVHAYEAQHPYGCKGRPFDPTVDGKGVPDPTTANQVLFGLEGGKGHSIALGNPSVTKKLPLLKPGETLFYGGKGQFIRAMEDGGFGLWAPGDGIDFSGTLGADGIFFAGPWGTFELSKNGFHVKHASGARIDLGAIGGLPAPLNAIGSYCKIAAGAVDLNATAVTLGPDGTAPVSLAGVPALVSILSTVQTSLTQIATAITTFVSAGGAAFTPAALAAVPAAVTAAATAIGTAQQLLATNAKATT